MDKSWIEKIGTFINSKLGMIKSLTWKIFSILFLNS